MRPEALAARLNELEPGYKCRVLEDGTVACIVNLIFTRAIILGVTPSGYARRFCFDDKALADVRFDELKTEHDEPQGYIALR